jgi:hypothetical protein
MKGWLQKLSSLDRPGNFLSGRVELFLVRLFYGGFLWHFLNELPSRFSGQPRPNGLAHLFDITFVSTPAFETIRPWLIGVCLAGYVAGALPALWLSIMTAMAIALGTLANSQGAIGHSYQLVTMTLLAQLLVYLFHAARSAKEGRLRWLASGTAANRALVASIVVIAAAYVSSGAAKVIDSDGTWIYRTPWLAVQMLKSNLMEFYNGLTPQTGFFKEEVPLWIIHHPNIARFLFSGGLLLELGAFLVVAGRIPALVIGLSLIAFHQTLDLLMNLDFWEHQMLALIFLVNPVHYLLLAVQAVSGGGWAAGEGNR